MFLRLNERTTGLGKREFLMGFFEVLPNYFIFFFVIFDVNIFYVLFYLWKFLLCESSKDAQEHIIAKVLMLTSFLI